MDKYKPGYMGKVMPADDPVKLTDFVANKYDNFSKCYDAVKSESEKITNVSAVSTPGSSFTMQVSADSTTMMKIKENNTDPSISIKGDTVTAD